MNRSNRKKRLAAGILAAALLVGCGSGTKVIEGAPETAAEAVMAETAADVQTSDAAPENEAEAAGYSFLYEGLEMAPDMDSAAVIAALGEAKSYFEAESCAFHGLDKMYTYAGFEIDTYPQEDKDCISNIILKDDTVSTREGVSLFMTREDMTAAYGEDYEEDGGVCSYELGGMKLCFIFQGEEIRSIEYRSKVLESE